jgi:hypothetical protein
MVVRVITLIVFSLLVCRKIHNGKIAVTGEVNYIKLYRNLNESDVSFTFNTRCIVYMLCASLLKQLFAIFSYFSICLYHDIPSL